MCDRCENRRYSGFSSPPLSSPIDNNFLTSCHCRRLSHTVSLSLSSAHSSQDIALCILAPLLVSMTASLRVRITPQSAWNHHHTKLPTFPLLYGDRSLIQVICSTVPYRREFHLPSHPRPEREFAVLAFFIPMYRVLVILSHGAGAVTVKQFGLTCLLSSSTRETTKPTFIGLY